MEDRGKIWAGLLVFLSLIAFPAWYNLAIGKSGARMEIIIKTKGAAGKDRCVMPGEYMRTSHMSLLREWRDKVVRYSQRTHTSPDGRQFQRSLTNTCLDCHSNKSEFCDRCHDYNGVQPDCWDCHIAPNVERQ